MDWRVPLADLDYGPEEEEAVLSVLRGRWLTMGSVTQQFEAEFAAAHQVKHALAVTNATVALHLACLALGIGPGDEVIVPALTFVATANAVRYTGAEVRFADILGPEELTLDPADVERQVTPRTKAILPMHYGGYPCRMPEIMEIAAHHGLAVIEDAAHAPGVFYQGKALGAWGDMGCFSFFSNKNLSTGEGGMLATNRSDLAETVRLLRSHGMTSLTWDRHHGHAYSYDVVALGYNYRIDELRSALGRVQLAKLDHNRRRRQEIVAAYREGLTSSALTLPFASSDLPSAYHLFPILLPEGAGRQAFIDRLRQAGIQTSLHYPPLHRFSAYRQRYPNVCLPRTEGVAARLVTLPLYPTQTSAQVAHVITQVRAALDGISR